LNFISKTLLYDTVRSLLREIKVRGIGLFLLAFILVGLLLETYNFLRAVTPTGKFDSELGWLNPQGRFQVGETSYTINSAGFRMRESNSKKPKILVLGDSIGLGLGVNDGNVFTDYLEHEIPGYQVLNFSVNGYGIGQYFLMLKRAIEKNVAKLIVVVICTGNDIRNTITSENYGLNKPLFFANNGQLEFVDVNISRFSCHNMFSYSWFLKRKSFKYMKKNCVKKILGDEQTNEVIFQLLNRIEALGKQNGVKTLFVLSPSKSNFDEKKSFLERLKMEKKKDPENYHKPVVTSSEFYFKTSMKFFRDGFKKSNLIYLDLLNENEIERINPEELFIDHYHYSVEGHKFLAAKIKDFILQRNLLGS
jgi:lysophospholipase L1-like esterase